MRQKKTWQDHLSTAVEWGEHIVLILGALLLLTWLIEPVRHWMQEHELMDFEGIIAFSALAIMFVLRALDRQSDKIDRLVAAEEAAVIPDGIQRVYAYVDEVIDASSDAPLWGRSRRSFDVLGITLYTAWTHLQPQFKKKTFTDWEVTLSCMSAEFAKNEPNVPPDWADELPGRISQITEFIKSSAKDLESRNVRITLYLHDYLPAIHGFRVENDDVFCSFIHWEGDKLAKPFQFYEHFAATNRSVRARHYRLLFENWLERAHAGKAVPAVK